MKNLQNAPAIKIGIADDHQLFRYAIASVLNDTPFFHTILQAKDGEALLSLIECSKELPDILLMDIEMQNFDGIRATQLINERYPSIKVIALTSHDEVSIVLKMIRAGCCAYLKKDIDPDTLIRALQEIHVKGRYHADIYNLNATQLLGYQKRELAVSISENEKQFLKLTCEGFSHNEIAQRMFISAASIDRYRAVLFEKLDVNNRVTMVLEAIRRGLIIVNIAEKL